MRVRRSRLATPLLACLAAAATAILLAGCGSGGASASNSVVSKQQYTQGLADSPAPLADLHNRMGQVGGGTSEFDAQVRALRGYPIVVNAWAHWCIPCKAELPLFQRASLRYGRRVAFVGLNADDTTSAAKSFIAGYPLPYPSFEDPSMSIFRKLGGGAGLPTTFFLNRDGKVVLPKQGQFASQADLDAAIRRYAL